MELDPRKNKALRTTLILAAVAVAAYFAYQWWQNRNASAAAGGGITLGTNLNSALPDLSAGATGPESGIQGPGTSETVNISVPSTTQQQQPTAPKPPQIAVGPIIRGGVNIPGGGMPGTNKGAPVKPSTQTTAPVKKLVKKPKAGTKT